MFLKDKLSDLLEDRVTVGKGLEEPDLRSLKKEAAPGTLPHFIAWLETQSPTREYQWFTLRLGADGCLLSQYAASVRLGNYVDLFGGPDATAPFESLAFDKPHTFGAALQRALVLQANAVSGSSPILISEGV